MLERNTITLGYSPPQVFPPTSPPSLVMKNPSDTVFCSFIVLEVLHYYLYNFLSSFFARCFSSHLQSEKCLVLLFLIPTLSILISLCCHYPLPKYLLILFIFSYSLEFSPFSSCLPTHLVTGGIGKELLSQTRTQLHVHARTVIQVLQTKSVCGDAERGRADTGS